MIRPILIIKQERKSKTKVDSKVVVILIKKWNTELKGLLRIFLSPPKNVAHIAE